MKTYTKEELNIILEKHKLWLDGEPNGIRANLNGACLCGANLFMAKLSEANLSWTNLSMANLHEADLHKAYLCSADLYRSDLRGTNLSLANLSWTNLSMANLRWADLRVADLRGADLCRADLRGADLRMADLRMADLRGADLYGAKNVPFIPMTCPNSGSYIAYKKAYIECVKECIVVLEIPSDALRSSDTSRKCRASAAKVLRIENIDGSIPNGVTECRSKHNPNFVYRIGEIVSVPDFDTDRWNACAPGIHHFINRQEAVDY